MNFEVMNMSVNMSKLLASLLLCSIFLALIHFTTTCHLMGLFALYRFLINDAHLF